MHTILLASCSMQLQRIVVESAIIHCGCYTPQTHEEN